MFAKAMRDDVASDEGCARETHDRFGNDDVIEDWLCANERPGTLGGCTASVLFSYLCDVNVETTSNLPGGMISSAACIFLKHPRTPTTPTMSLYHHVYKSP